MTRNFVRSLAAVLGGNAIYYLFLPHLPIALRHHIFRMDAGLLLDSLICIVLFILLSWHDRR